MENEQTTESFEPTQQEGGEGASPTPGRTFRRRRRRNKNRNAGQGGGNAGAIQAQGEDGGQANAAGDSQAQQGQAQAGNQQNGQQQRQGGQNQNGQGFGGRRKRRKKFFENRQGGGQQAPIGNRADRQPQFNGGGGNFNGNGGGGRRKQKQRGGRSFVGPMDHLYREGNGNYADAPPSTIAVNGNQNSQRRQNNAHMHDTGHQAQFLGRHFEPPPPVIAEDAPTRVYCFIDDLFFTAKINESARKLGVKVGFLKADKKEDLARLLDAPENEKPALILFDLNNANNKPLTVIPKLRTKLKRTVSIIGFLSHLQGDLKAKAVEAGCDTVMPRSAFSQNLPNLLRRYGLDEKENETADAQHAYF